MADLKLLKDLRWRLDDIRDMLMKEGFNGQRIYGCDEWSTPTVNLATAIGVIDKALVSPPVAVQEEKCRTCNGHGLVGGFVSDGDGGGGYDSEPCPDCTPRLTANEVLAWLDAEGIEVTNVQFSRLAAMKGDQP